MMKIKNLLYLFILLIFAVVPLTAVAQMSDEDKAIAIAAGHEEFVDFLAEKGDWGAWAYSEDDNEIWVVDFYLENDEEEWLGYAVLNIETGEVYEAFAPKPLPTDVHAELQSQVLKLVQNDEEMLARIDDISQWEHWIHYDVYEQVWYVAYYRGLESWAGVVEVEFIDDSYEVQYIAVVDVVDPSQFEEQEAIANQKNQAIALAYEADGIWEVMDGYDDWTTLVSDQGDGNWAVQFISEDDMLFFALVNPDRWEILETSSDS